MTAEYARERDTYVGFETKCERELRTLMDGIQTTTVLPGALRREIRQLQIMRDCMQRAIQECDMRIECNVNALEKQGESFF